MGKVKRHQEEILHFPVADNEIGHHDCPGGLKEQREEVVT